MVKFISAFFVAAVAQEKEPAAVNTLGLVYPEVEKDVNIVDGPQRGLQAGGFVDDLSDLANAGVPDVPLPEELKDLSITANIDWLNNQLMLAMLRRAAAIKSGSDPSIVTGLDLEEER